MKNRNLRLLCTIIFLVIMSFTIPTGCIAVRDVSAEPKNQTLGQELIDLKQARDLEVISEDEYQEQKTRLLNREET